MGEGSIVITINYFKFLIRISTRFLYNVVNFHHGNSYIELNN